MTPKDAKQINNAKNVAIYDSWLECIYDKIRDKVRKGKSRCIIYFSPRDRINDPTILGTLKKKGWKYSILDIGIRFLIIDLRDIYESPEN